MRKLLLFSVILLAVGGSAFGQGAVLPPKSVNSVVNGLMRPVVATITVCAANTAGLPCAPALANTVFSDPALTQAKTNPFTTDANGNYQLALAAGTYTVTETASGFAGYSYQVTVVCAAGGCTAGPLSITSLTVSGAGSVQGLTVGLGADSVATSTVLGSQALSSNTTGFANTAVGYQALKANTTGGSSTFGGNTAVGASALINNLTGDNNTALGLDALYTNTTGYSNTAVGSNALGFGDGGYQNVAVGWRALFNGQAGNSNTAVGVKSLNANLTGTNNVALGYFAGGYELGSNAFYVDNQDRGSTVGDKAGALLYGTFNATPSSQTLRVNATLTVSPGLVSSLSGNDLQLQPGGGSGWLVKNSSQDLIPNGDISRNIGNASNRVTTAFLATTYSTAPNTQTGATYTVATTDNTIRDNGAGTLTVTLPAVASSIGRKLRFVTIVNFTVVSASANVIPLAGGAAGTAILAGTAGKWADLECDGSNWIITASN